MKILLLGQKEIASVLGLSMAVAQFSQHDLCIYLSPEAAPGHSGVDALDELEVLECALCDRLANDAQAAALGLLGLDELSARTGRSIGLLPAPNSEEGLAVLRDERPDLIVSVRYRKIFKEAAIAIPKCGVINLHSGVLPQYRGAMATFWSMLNGETEIGTTLHYISDGTIDTGPIIGIARRPLDYARSYLSNVLDLYPAGVQMIAEAVVQIGRAGRATSTPQTGAGRYYSFPKKPDIERFRSLNHSLFGDRDLEAFVARYGRV